MTAALSIPTIGIGAGLDVDGQVLVFHDLVKYGSEKVAKFVKQFADADTVMRAGLRQYVQEVKTGRSPKKSIRTR